MFLPKQLNILLAFYPRSPKKYTTVGRKAVPFSRSVLSWNEWFAFCWHQGGGGTDIQAGRSTLWVIDWTGQEAGWVKSEFPFLQTIRLLLLLKFNYGNPVLFAPSRKCSLWMTYWKCFFLLDFVALTFFFSRFFTKYCWQGISKKNQKKTFQRNWTSKLQWKGTQQGEYTIVNTQPTPV